MRLLLRNIRLVDSRRLPLQVLRGGVQVTGQSDPHETNDYHWRGFWGY